MSLSHAGGRYPGMSGRMPWNSVRGLVIGGFGLLVILLACVTIGASLQVRRHQSNIEDLEFHSQRAALIQTVESQAAVSGLLLQRYVDAGGDHYVEEINAHATNAQVALEQVLNMGNPPGFEEVTSTGLKLLQDAARAAQLRLQGDTDLARQVLEEIVPVFRDYRLTLEGLAAEEQAQVAQLKARADDTGRLAFWLLAASGTLGVMIGLAVSLKVARSIIKPLGSLEDTARLASGGNLAARAQTSGPKEFVHLGTVLNEMMAGIESRTADLYEANRKLQSSNYDLVEARNEAATDPLTGLGNHRSFHRKLREEIVKARATGACMGLVIIDLDGFKQINDTVGHLAGDQVLRDLANALRDVASSDFEYRYGGDELAVLAPGADQAATVDLAERLKESVLGVPPVGGQQVTASLGVACFPEAAETAEELVYRADMAMYWAKSTGKNRVVAWDKSFANNLHTSRGPRYTGTRNQTGVIAGLVAALGAKDQPTRDHGDRCSHYAGELARALGLDDAQINAVQLAALLHDVGKIAVPDEVLQKPDPLSPEEMETMRRHSEYGASMLSNIEVAAAAVPGVLHHHEHFDGSGYPHGLSGEDIPLSARIMLVVDAFDSMTSDRPYRSALSTKAALEELKRYAGAQFDPVVLQAFLRLIARNGDMHAADAHDEPAPGPGERLTSAA